MIRHRRTVIGDPLRIHGVGLDDGQEDDSFRFWPSNPTIYVATDGRPREEDDRPDPWVIVE